MATRFRRLPWFALALTFTLHSAAQPKRKPKAAAPKKEAKEAPAKAEPAPPDSGKKAAEPSGEKAAEKPAPEKPAEAAPPAGPMDLGEPPPKGAGAASEAGETKLSPLTPEPDEFPKGGVTPPPPSYDTLLSRIAALRSRVAAVTTTLYKSKLKIAVAAEGDDAQVASFVVTLDDGVVYTAPERFSPSEPEVVYAHAVAPGHHVIGIEVERYDGRNREFRTWQSSKFTVIVPENETLSAIALLEDDSAMAEDFPEDRDGEYELSIKLRAQVEE